MKSNTSINDRPKTTSPGNSTDPESLQPICPCQIEIHSEFLKTKGLIPRISGIEVSDGTIALNPLLAPLPSLMHEYLEQVASQTLLVKNPSRRKLFLNLQQILDSHRRFDGMAPYFDCDTGKLIEIPISELSEQHTYHLTKCGKVAFTTLRSRERTYNPLTRQEEKIVFRMLKQIFRSPISREQVSESIATSEYPEVYGLLMLRIARAYHMLLGRRASSYLEKAETYALLNIAPIECDETYLRRYSPENFDMARASEIMLAYHSQPGIPPLTAYRVTLMTR